MRHGCQVRNDRLARDILAKDDRQLPRLFAKAVAGDQFMQDNAFALLIGQFDADHCPAGNGGDAGGERRHVARNVVRQLDDAAGLNAGGRFQLVHGDDRAGADFDDLALDVEIIEHGFQQPRIAFQRDLVDRVGTRFRRRAEQIKRRQDITVAQRQSGLPTFVRLRFCRGRLVLNDRLGAPFIDQGRRARFGDVGRRGLEPRWHHIIFFIKRGGQGADGVLLFATTQEPGSLIFIQTEALCPDDDADDGEHSAEAPSKPDHPISRRCKGHQPLDKAACRHADRAAKSAGQAFKCTGVEQGQARIHQRDARQNAKRTSLPTEDRHLGPKPARVEQHERHEQANGRPHQPQQKVGGPCPRQSQQIAHWATGRCVHRRITGPVAGERQHKDQRAEGKRHSTDQRAAADCPTFDRFTPFRCPGCHAAPPLLRAHNVPVALMRQPLTRRQESR